MTAKDKTLREQGLVSVLQTLHDELDAALLAAYGWSDLIAVIPAEAGIQNATAWTPAWAGVTDSAFAEALLERLVALNAERAREEAAGHIRWLRPAFQKPQAALVAVDPEKQPKTTSTATAETPIPAASEKSPWPATLPEQMALLARLLATAPAPLAESAFAARITGKGPWKKRLPDLLQTLVALGRARQEGEPWVAV